MTTGDIERTKLVANALDRASTACFTVGVATPLAGLAYNFGGVRDNVSPAGLLVGLVGWITASLALHLFARKVIAEL